MSGEEDFKRRCDEFRKRREWRLKQQEARRKHPHENPLGRERIIITPGTPQPTDLNFIPRVFGKYASGRSGIDTTDRVFIGTPTSLPPEVPKIRVELHSTEPEAVRATMLTVEQLGGGLIEEPDGFYYLISLDKPLDYIAWACERQGYVKKVIR